MNKSEIDTLNDIARALRMDAAALVEGRNTVADIAAEIDNIALAIDCLLRPHMDAAAAATTTVAGAGITVDGIAGTTKHRAAIDLTCDERHPGRYENAIAVTAMDSSGAMHNAILTWDGRWKSDGIDAIDARLAELESCVRTNGHRIDAAREAMRECTGNAHLHHSVRYLADKLAINLASSLSDHATTPTPADPDPSPTCPKCAQDIEVDEALRPTFDAIDRNDFARAHELLAPHATRWPDHPNVVRATAILHFEEDALRAVVEVK